MNSKNEVLQHASDLRQTFCSALVTPVLCSVRNKVINPTGGKICLLVTVNTVIMLVLQPSKSRHFVPTEVLAVSQKQ